MVEVAGTVLNTFSGEPVAGASVSICGRRTATNSEGEFSIDLNRGACTISITKSGYEPTSESLIVRTATHRTYYIKPIFKPM